MTKFNPFNPTSVVNHNLFAGRANQVNNICAKLTQLKYNMPASFLLYGERGIGKTALAKLIRYVSSAKLPQLHDLSLLTSYYMIEEGQSLSSVLQESLNKLTEEMDRKLVDEIGHRVGNLFKNGKFEIGAFGASATFTSQPNESTREITIKDQTVSILSNIVKGLSKGEYPKDGILIIIDELSNLGNLRSAASVFRNIITSLDVEGLGKVSFLLIGYKEDVDKFFSIDTSARRTFDLIELGTMSSADAEEVLTKGFDAARVSWDKDALDRHIYLAGGYPHAIQVIGHNLIEKDTDNIIDSKDWKDIVYDTAFDLQDKEFSTLYNFRKKQTERDKILAYLARENRPMSRSELKELNISKNLYRCLQDLKKLGAIKENDEGDIFLQSQLFTTAILLDLAFRRLPEKTLPEVTTKK